MLEIVEDQQRVWRRVDGGSGVGGSAEGLEEAGRRRVWSRVDGGGSAQVIARCRAKRLITVSPAIIGPALNIC